MGPTPKKSRAPKSFLDASQDFRDGRPVFQDGSPDFQDGRKLPRKTLESLRKEAVKRVIWGEKPQDVIKEMGFHPSRIYAWLRAFEREGEQGLKARSVPGRPDKFGDKEREKLETLILDKSPRQLGLESELWDAQALKTLILREFDTALSSNTLRQLMQRMGGSTQKPAEQIKHYAEASALAWLDDDYPKLKRQVSAQKGRLFFLTSRLTQSGHWLVSAVSPRGKQYFMLQKNLAEHHVSAHKLTGFLQKLMQEADKKLFIVVYGESRLYEIFQLELVRLFLQDQMQVLSVIQLPAIQEKPIKTDTKQIYSKNISSKKAAPNLQSSMEDWLLLLNQSLLDYDYPLSSFLEILNRGLNGVSLIATNLHSAASPIRPIYEMQNLHEVIAMNKRITEHWYSNPFLSALNKPGDLYCMDDLLPWEQWPDNAYCRAFTRYKKGVHILGLCLAGPGDTLCGLFIYRWEGQGPFSDELKVFLQRLRPHLETAISLAINHWHNTYTLRALSEVTDHLQIAALVLDGNAMVVKASDAAEDILRKQHPIKMENHRLRFSNLDDQRQFEQAVRQSIAWRREPIGSRPLEAMRFSYGDENWIGVLVQPITPATLAIPHSAAAAPQVVVYISDPAQTRPNPQHKIIVQLFKLSNREARLTMLLTQGNTLGQAADIMNITQATARTYLQHIYEKVGVNRRQDLVQRVMKSVALLV